MLSDRYIIANSEPALSFRVSHNIHNHLAPGLATTQRLQGARHAFKTNKALVLECGTAEFALRDQIKDPLPYCANRLGLETSILAPVQPNDTDILQQHPIQRNLLDLASRKPNDQQSRIPRHALQTGINHANRVIDNINTRLAIAGPVGSTQLLHLLGPVLIAVVDDVVRTEFLRDLALALGACRSDHRCTLGLGHLHSGEAHTTSSRVNKHPVTSLDPSAMHQTTVGGGCRYKQTSGIFEAPPRRDGKQRLLRGQNAFRIGALGRTEDPVASLEAWGLRGSGNSDNGAGELGATDPGQWRLVLIFALNLEDVEEVGAGGVNLNQVFVRCWGRSCDRSDLEIQRTLMFLCEFLGPWDR